MYTDLETKCKSWTDGPLWLKLSIYYSTRDSTFSRDIDCREDVKKYRPTISELSSCFDEYGLTEGQVHRICSLIRSDLESANQKIPNS